MSDYFNYGPRMNFGQLHYERPKSTPSEYLGMQTSRLSDTTSSMSSSLGAHWKKVPSIAIGKDPKTPTIISSFSNISNGTGSIVPSERLDSSTVTSHGNVLGSENSSLNSLSEHTDVREERQCFTLQEFGIGILTKAVHNGNKRMEDTYEVIEKVFEMEKKINKKMLEQTKKEVETMEERFDEELGELEEKTNDAQDKLNQMNKTFKKKAKIEKFVRENDDVYYTVQDTLKMLENDKKRVEKIQKMLDFNRPSVSPLTVFEHEDPRVGEVLQKVIGMIRSLPLSNLERADMEGVIRAMEENVQYDGKFKCETLIRHVLAVMSSWQETKSMSSVNSDNWKSVGESLTNSSFQLTDLPLDDSNLSDLEGDLRSARIKLAVNESIHMDSWPSASNFSRWSSVSDARTEILSLGEPMTLSSYQLTSRDGQSTTSSLSLNSMPDQSFDSMHDELMSEDPLVKTALSQGDIIVAQPPRTGESASIQDGTGSIHSTLNSSTASIGEIVEDALHTAKELAETQTTNLLEALHNSASKCGVAISDLMTAVSTSSESLSDTQTSHSITH